MSGQGSDVDSLSAASDSWRGFVIPPDDEAVVRRSKSLAATRPIHDLDRNKSSFVGDFWDRYVLTSLALSTIDQVALQMGIAGGLGFDEAVRYCANEASRQCPTDPPETWMTVASRVVSGVTTDDPVQFEYVTTGAEGPVRKVHTFRVLYSQWSSDSTVYLRASEEAINVLVGGLDVNIESAQIAAEAQMRALVDRGALDAAAHFAEQARYRTITYLEHVRTIVRDTLLDPDSHDWAVAVPEELNRALDHVVDRISTERALIVSVEDRRDVLDDPGMRMKANVLIRTIQDCLRRHTELQRHLLNARTEMRRAQDDRFKRRPGSIRRADLVEDLLLPLLAAAPLRTADWADRCFGWFAAPRQRYMPSLARLVGDLSTLPPVSGTGGEVPDVVFADEEARGWFEPYWDAADDVFDGLDEPVTLSALLRLAGTIADAAELDREPLVSALTHQAFGFLATPLVDGDDGERLLVAIPTGDRFSGPGASGDDLLLVPAVFTSGAAHDFSAFGNLFDMSMADGS